MRQNKGPEQSGPLRACDCAGYGAASSDLVGARHRGSSQDALRATAAMCASPLFDKSLSDDTAIARFSSAGIFDPIAPRRYRLRNAAACYVRLRLQQATSRATMGRHVQ